MGSQRVRHNLATEQQQQPYTDQHVSVPEYASCQLSLGHNQTNIQYTCNNSKALPGYDEKSISQKSFQLYLLCCRRRQWQPTSSTLAWKIPWTEEPGRPQTMGSLRDTTERLHFHFSLSCTGEGNGNPLPSSCLENPRDGGAWWAAVYGVTESNTTEVT